MEYEENLISVIIPVFNAEKYIENTLNSIFLQNYKKLEVILIDDCSSDHSVKKIEHYKMDRSEIKLISLEKNSGAATARNVGLKAAKGRYIAFLDSDDEWKAGKLTAQIEVLKQTKACLCFTAIEMMDINGVIIKKKRKVKEWLTYKQLLKNTMIATSTVVVDRNVTGSFVMPLCRLGQDYATWLFLLRNYGDAIGINQVYVEYRCGKGSLSSKKIKNYKKVYDVQVKNEQIPRKTAALNCLCYMFNAFVKYYL